MGLRRDGEDNLRSVSGKRSVYPADRRGSYVVGRVTSDVDDIGSLTKGLSTYRVKECRKSRHVHSRRLSRSGRFWHWGRGGEHVWWFK